MKADLMLQALQLAKTSQPGIAPRTAEAIIEEADVYLTWLDEHADKPTTNTKTTSGNVHHLKTTPKRKKKKSYYVPTGRPPGRPKKGSPAVQVAQGQKAA